MLRPNTRNKSIGKGWWGLLLGAAALLLLPTCEAGPTNGTTAQLGQAVGQGSDTVAADTPRQLSAKGTFRVSPAWSPSGRWLAVAGRRGVGLYLLPTTDGAERVVDAGFRGPWRWQRSGARDVLCFGRGPVAEAIDADTWEVLPPCPDVTYDPERGDPIGQVGSQTFYSNSRMGTVSVVSDGQTRTIPLDPGAWGAKVSPDGHYVAYCTGTLVKAELLLLDVVAGRTTSLGPGAHAAWFPDSSRLVYTRITQVERVGLSALITAADLRFYNVASASSRPLEATEDRSELEPSVSPDGQTLAYADWRSGAILLRRAPERGAP